MHAQFIHTLTQTSVAGFKKSVGDKTVNFCIIRTMENTSIMATDNRFVRELNSYERITQNQKASKMNLARTIEEPKLPQKLGAADTTQHSHEEGSKQPQKPPIPISFKLSQ